MQSAPVPISAPLDYVQKWDTSHLRSSNRTRTRLNLPTRVEIEENDYDEESEEEHPGDRTPLKNRKIAPVTVRGRDIWDSIVQILKEDLKKQ